MFTPRRKRPIMTIGTPTPAKRFRPTPTMRYSQMNRKTSWGPRRSGNLTQQVKSLQRVVKDLAPEIKIADINIEQSNIPTTGTVQHVTAIAQGDGLSDRTGFAINVVGLAVRGELLAAADIPPDGIIRYALVQHKQQVADTAPTAEQIFQDADAVFGLPNRDMIEKFRVLYLSPPVDIKRIGLDTDNTNGIATFTNCLEHNWKGNIKVIYDGTGTTDIGKNGIYFVILNSVGAATNDFRGVCRVTYTDV